MSVVIDEHALLYDICENFNRLEGYTPEDSMIADQLYAQLMGWA
jgi:hypothetical protein